MKTETHLKYAKFLADKHFSNHRKISKYLFIIGCIEPDINPFSYLKGFFAHPFFGHNWVSREKYILNKSASAESKKLNCFKLGRLIHYVCDSFTYTHNDSFSGGVRLHTLYEKQLHALFDKNYELPSSPKTESAHLNQILSQLHNEYYRLAPSKQNDIKFIRLAVQNVLTHGIPLARKEQKLTAYTALQK